jgi:hypothetical protein
MAERQNTLLCTFDPKSPRTSAYEIHEWIQGHLQIPEHEVLVIQIDGPRRQVFIKLKQSDELQAILQATNGIQVYKHSNGELSHVRIEITGMGTKHKRIANLPPEVPDGTLRTTLAQYGDIKTILEETRSKAYRYAVSNGVKLVTTDL